jgi:type IV pilus assembly protein PilM
VEFFNPLRNVAVGGNLNLEEVGRQAHTMGAMVGLALRQVSACPMELNLRPASVVRQHVMAERRPALILAAACVFLTLGAFWMYYNRAAAVTADVLEKVQPPLNDLKEYDGRLNTIRSGMKSQEETAAPLMASISERDYWVRVLNDINARLPKDFVWITSFQPENFVEAPAPSSKSSKSAKAQPKQPDKARPTAVINVRGLYLENPQGAAVVDQFINKLNESEFFTVEEDPATRVRETPNPETWAYAYAFRLNLKNPISIPSLTKQ